MSKVLSVLILSLAATSAANAFERVAHSESHVAANHESVRITAKDTTTSAVAAPEIDPASAMSALTLLAGGLAVLRGRRLPLKRKP